MTGGAVGIGRAITERFAGQGAHLILTDINGKALDEAATALHTRGFSVETFFMDVAEQEGVERVRQAILAQGGPIDLLVNNAGVVFGGGFQDVPFEGHRLTYSVNLLGLVGVT